MEQKKQKRTFRCHKNTDREGAVSVQDRKNSSATSLLQSRPSTASWPKLQQMAAKTGSPIQMILRGRQTHMREGAL